MKPFPEAVQRAFPCAPDRLSARPWWRVSWSEGSGAYSYSRMDGQRTVVAPHNLAREEVVAYDAAHPLPHPGYRAGQVWAAEDGSSVVVSRVLLEHNTVLLDIVGSGWHIEQFARAWPYLMADPSCPHLAPWSPAEGKP